jgi:periplasmic mercuric ion binding protein
VKSLLFALTTSASLMVAAPSMSAEQTARIEVTGLFCASCPYIAAQAINSIESAKIVDGFYDPNSQLAQFVVQYDDTLTTLADLVKATDQYGYPARLVEGDGES